MSKKFIVDLDCPKCGRKTKTEIWSTMNTQLNPEAKKKLLEGQINIFRCDNCSFETVVDASFLYHDMEKKFLVYYLPFEDVEKHLDMFTENAEMSDPLLEKRVELSDHFKHMHFVFSMDELVRYVVF